MINPSSEAQLLLLSAIEKGASADLAIPLLIRALKEGADLSAPLKDGKDAMTLLLEVCLDGKAAVAKALVLCGYNPLPSSLHRAIAGGSYPVANALIEGAVRANCRGPQGENALESLLMGPGALFVEKLVENCVEMGLDQEKPVTGSSWQDLLSEHALKGFSSLGLEWAVPSIASENALSVPSAKAQEMLLEAIDRGVSPESAIPLLKQALEQGADLHKPLFSGQNAMDRLLDVCVNEKDKLAGVLVLCGYNPLPSALHQAVEEENYRIAKALIEAAVRVGFRGPRGENALESLLLGPAEALVEDLVKDCIALGLHKTEPVTAPSWDALLDRQGLEGFPVLAQTSVLPSWRTPPRIGFR